MQAQVSSSILHQAPERGFLGKQLIKTVLPGESSEGTGALGQGQGKLRNGAISGEGPALPDPAGSSGA